MRVFSPAFLIAACAVSRVSAFAPPRAAAAHSLSSHTPLSAFLPEHVDALASIDHSSILATSSQFLADAAEAAVDATKENTGWWQSYLNIFENAIRTVHSTIDGPLRNMGVTETWGISIVIFTASVRSLLLPLSIQQSKNTEYMKALKPYMNEIKEKFPDNEQMRNQVTAKLFEDAQQNPLAGCLTSLAQLPIFLGLYRGVRLLAIDGQLNEPFLWIPSLEGPVGPPDYRGLDWLTTGWTQGADGLPVPSLGWETTLAFLVMPVVLVLGQKLTMDILSPADLEDTSNMSAEEKENQERQKTIFKFLPLLIGFFSLQVPAGLTIYWFTSNLFTLSQSLAVKAYYAANPPEIDLPDYWDSLDNVEEMTAEERRKAAEAGLSAGPTFTDLKDESKFHYVVQRGPLRADSEAWKRIESGPYKIPTEMEAWVGEDASGSSTAVVAESEDNVAPEKETSAATP